MLDQVSPSCLLGDGCSFTSWKVTQPNVSPDNLTPEPATLASLCKEQKVPYGMIYLGVSGLRERDRKGAIKGVHSYTNVLLA